MHLYKPACADIPSPKLGLPKCGELALKCRRHLAVSKPPPQAACGPVGRSGAAERRCLEKFLHVHGISLQETTRVETGMAYRYLLVATSSSQGTTLKPKAVVIKEIMIEIAKQTPYRKRKMHSVSPPSWAASFFRALNCLFSPCSKGNQAHLWKLLTVRCQ